MNILGLDLGTNSIGWALLSGERRDGYNKKIIVMYKKMKKINSLMRLLGE